MYEQIKSFINPSKNPDLAEAQDFQRQHLPTLWLLGKTGAGKSSLVQAVTGESEVTIGNGFTPCTKSSSTYLFPEEMPIFRFLDTRGLGEADYDAQADIQEIAHSSNALVVVMKVDEPEQSSVLTALKQIKYSKQIKHLLLVQTAICGIDDAQRQRMTQHHIQQVESCWGASVSSVSVDFEHQLDSGFYHEEQLIEALAELLPVIGLMVDDKEHSNAESENFDQLEREVLWYSGTAAASDLIPAVGLVSVPAIQAKMLHSLANQYGVEWSRRTFAELISAFGSGFALQYSINLGTRQLVKIIPAYGQTVGAAAAAALSFGSTYGLGRAACYYFYQKSRGEPLSEDAMQNLYKKALKKGKRASGYE